MSRRGFGLCFTALLFAASGSALAQQASGPAGDATDAATDARVGAMVDRAKAAYGPAAPQRPKTCGKEDKNGDITVCAPEDGKQWRVPPTSETDPNSRQATRTGVPRAPQLDRGSCKGKGQLGCLGLGRAGEPIYMIDLKSIPETPKDSDAEKVANGEMSDR